MNKTFDKGKITAKLMEEKLKEGWGTAHFADELGMSVQDFMVKLEKTFRGSALQIYKRRLKKNDKLIERQLKRRACSKITTVPKNEGTEVPETTDSTVIVDEDTETTETTAVTINADEEEHSELEEALKRETELSKALMKLENARKEVITIRRNLSEEAIKLEEDLFRLRNEFVKGQKKALELLKQIKENEEELERIKKQRRKTKDSLDKVREEIAELRKVQVNIVDDIEIIPAEEYAISSEWKELRNSWLDDERFSVLTVIEISLLAKAIILRRAMLEEGRRFEFVFVSDEMERLFNELS